jgi:hypothetical protein
VLAQQTTTIEIKLKYCKSSGILIILFYAFAAPLALQTNIQFCG